MSKPDQSEEASSSPRSISDVNDGLEELASEEEKVRIADVLSKFGERSFAPVMLVFALVEISPLGAIPGVPSFLALCVAIVAVQLLFARETIWVPSWIACRSVSGKKLGRATDKIEGVASWLDGLAKGRLQVLTRGPALQFTAAIILALCLLVPPLEVLPWASAGPMLAIALISLAIMVRDGLAMLAAWAIASLAIVALGLWYLNSSASGGFLPFL